MPCDDYDDYDVRKPKLFERILKSVYRLYFLSNLQMYTRLQVDLISDNDCSHSVILVLWPPRTYIVGSQTSMYYTQICSLNGGGPIV